MMTQLHKLIFNPFQENCYVVWDENGACAIIDPGCSNEAECGKLCGFIEENHLAPSVILLTHAHPDHIYGVGACVEKYNIPVYMDAREETTIKGFNASFGAAADIFPYNAVKEGEVVQAGVLSFRALSTPGHTMGGLCWWMESEGLLFSGDTLFAGCIGRTDNPWASWDMLKKSLKDTLMALDGTVDVYPGHGSATSIGQERITNPFIVDEFGENGYEL